VGLAAIEAVCADEWLPRREIAGVLASLVDRSLVESEATARDEHRFRLLFPIRSFARERAAEAGELDELERRHAEFYADRVEEAEPNLIGPTAFEWAARLREDTDDIRAALQWSRRSGVLEPGLRIVAAIYIFWEDYDRRREWMERVVDLVSVEQDKATFPLQGRATLVRARALVAASKLLEAWDMRLATAFAQEAVELAEAMGDARVLARARVSLGTLLGRRSGRVAESRRLLEAGYDWFTEVGDRYGAAGALFGLGLGEPAALAIPRWARARELYEAVGDELGVANMLYLSGLRLVREGPDLDTAETLLREAVERAPRHGSERETAHAHSGLGHLGVVRGNDPDAHVLVRAALPVFRTTGDVRCTARCETLLGVAAGQAGDREEALRAYRAAIAAAERVHDLVTLADALDGVGSVLPPDRDRLALILHAAAAATREVAGRSSNLPGTNYEADIRERRDRAGAAADTAWAEGSALAPMEAARLALEASLMSNPLGAGKG
jgi:tetratricopeptide (TPR) repeat protein